MTETVIRVENLSKKYLLRHANNDRNGLRHLLQQKLISPLRWLRHHHSPPAQWPAKEEFWALRDLSLEIKRGEVVGLIGRNGAGKSTLLKILSRITEPTSGRVRIKGRVASLLEVGTGFHPELTGRENIFLNGAILGMSRNEIKKKFVEIVSFAEIEKFLDTPVKFYSSGMYVRLAFAVAAHLEPEILVVDEVLAVGDHQFQKKCLGRMEDVANREGRTVLFVSHNMGAIQALCRRGIYLHSGRIAADTGAAEAVRIYLRSFEQAGSGHLQEERNPIGKGEIRIVKVELFSGHREPTLLLTTGKPARFVFHLSDLRAKTVLNFLIYDMKGNHILIFNSDNRSPRDSGSPLLQNIFVCDVDKLPLLPGRYRIQVNLGCEDTYQDGLDSAAVFEVAEGYFDQRREPETPYAVVTTSHRWTLPGLKS